MFFSPMINAKRQFVTDGGPGSWRLFESYVILFGVVVLFVFPIFVSNWGAHSWSLIMGVGQSGKSSWTNFEQDCFTTGQQHEFVWVVSRWLIRRTWLSPKTMQTTQMCIMLCINIWSHAIVDTPKTGNHTSVLENFLGFSSWRNIDAAGAVDAGCLKHCFVWRGQILRLPALPHTTMAKENPSLPSGKLT